MTDPKDIRFLVLDVDGTLTDTGIYLLDDGREAKKFNARDGMGIKYIQKEKKILVGLISGSLNQTIIRNRAKMLCIKYWYAGSKDKVEVLRDWVEELEIDFSQVAYIGDDLNDISIFDAVGLRVCPADAVEVIQQKSDIILKRNGGDACVREFIDSYILD